MNRASFKISAIILVKNDEARIAECIKNLTWSHEIIVVDNSSSDKTKTIAKSLGAKIVEQGSTLDFSALRNAGQKNATGDFLLYIDSDEIVTPELRNEIKKTVETYEPGISPVAYFLKRKNFYLGRPWPYRDKMERFFWAKGLIEWAGQIHESPRVNGTVGELTNPLIHNTHRNLEEMVTKTNEWSEIEAGLRFSAHHQPVVWWRFLSVMTRSFNESYFHQKGFRAGAVGWIESIFQAFSSFITYAKLWEMQNKK